tara:strand:- start:1281 stop:1466 length:186 start_codon:yes stop_codon:yes gene_type:complete
LSSIGIAVPLKAVIDEPSHGGVKGFAALVNVGTDGQENHLARLLRYGYRVVCKAVGEGKGA